MALMNEYEQLEGGSAEGQVTARQSVPHFDKTEIQKLPPPDEGGNDDTDNNTPPKITKSPRLNADSSPSA